MNEILVVNKLKKTFKLNRKQMKLQRTTSNHFVAVDGISFCAYRGEIFGLLGPNGAGKTTTLRMIATLIKPDSGDATVDGKSIIKDPDGVRSKIGFLTSELKLEDFFTPDYLYDYFSELHGVEPSVSEKRKAELFERFGIDKFAHVKVGDLSTGMKQKVSLVISVVHDPDFIIFDEPTNGLDVITAKTITDYLAELREAGKTIIISTHIFTLAEKLCDRIGIIIGGHMVAVGTIPEIAGEKNLEDAFFDLYRTEVGEDA